jgi:hypothetical protein
VGVRFVRASFFPERGWGRQIEKSTSLLGGGVDETVFRIRPSSIKDWNFGCSMLSISLVSMSCFGGLTRTRVNNLNFLREK